MCPELGQSGPDTLLSAPGACLPVTVECGWRLPTLQSAGCQGSPLCGQCFRYSSSQTGLFKSDTKVFALSHLSMFCHSQTDNYHALCSEHRNNLCRYQFDQRNAQLEKTSIENPKLRRRWEKLVTDRVLPTQYPVPGVSSPPCDNPTLHAIQWPSIQPWGLRHSYKYEWGVTHLQRLQCLQWRVSECGQESLAQAESVRPACTGASRMLVIAQLTFPWSEVNNNINCIFTNVINIQYFSEMFISWIDFSIFVIKWKWFRLNLLTGFG